MSKTRVILIAQLVLFCCFSLSQAGQDWRTVSPYPGNVLEAIRFQENVITPLEQFGSGELTIRFLSAHAADSEEELVKKLNSGDMEAALVPSGLFKVFPSALPLITPFRFDDYSDVDRLRPALYPQLEAEAEKNGLKLIFWLDNDFGMIWSARPNINSLDALKNARFLSFGGSGDSPERNALQALGAAMVVMQPEKGESPHSLLQSGRADSAILSAPWAMIMGLPPFLNHVVTNNIQYAPLFLICSQSAWNKLTPETQKKILGLRGQVAEDFRNGNTKFALQVLGFCQKNGARETRMKNGDIKKARQILRQKGLLD